MYYILEWMDGQYTMICWRSGHSGRNWATQRSTYWRPSWSRKFPFLSSPLWKKKRRNCNIFWNPILSTCIRHPQHKKCVRHLSRKPDDSDPKLISWHIPLLCEMLMFKYSKIWDICEFSKYPFKATRFCWGCMGHSLTFLRWRLEIT